MTQEKATINTLAAEDAPSKPANAKPEQDLSDDMALYEAYLMAAATGDAAEIEPGQLRKTWAMAQGVFAHARRGDSAFEMMEPGEFIEHLLFLDKHLSR